MTMITPHGGKLVDRKATKEDREKILKEFDSYHSLSLDKEDAQELDNIAYGVFSPLEGFLTQKDFKSVLEKGRLLDGTPWTIPIVLDVEESEIGETKPGDIVGLTYNGQATAIIEVEDIYEYDKMHFKTAVFATTDDAHPGVEKVNDMKPLLIGGKITLLNDIGNPYPSYTLSPKQTRDLFEQKGWKTVVAFQTRNTPHLGHEYVQKTALSITDGLFINPLIGKKKSGDFKDEVILESYKALMHHYYPKKHASMAVLHTEMRYGGPKEAVHHAIMRQNFGCTHFIVGRDHAGVGDYYGPFDAHKIFDEYPDLEIKPIFFRSFFFCRKCNSIANDKVCPHSGEDIIIFAGRRIRAMLNDGEVPPSDMMRPEVAETILSYDHPFVE
ncbi:MAG: Sulfate adenylyltransferase [Candidatus Thorarchaeota archaeon]|nr:MAG: Sulfate adenylyltransferase [Candidatus Thorarchaeota archaeon]